MKKEIYYIQILIFIFLLSFILLSCTSIDSQIKKMDLIKPYENSYFIDVEIPQSVKILNTTIQRAPKTINEEKFEDKRFYDSESLNPKVIKSLNVDSLKMHFQLFLPENISEENKIKGKFLLVHGFAGCSFSFNKLAPLLADAGFLVVALDLPNFGYSDRVKIKLNSNCLADLIYNFLVQFDNHIIAKNNIFQNFNQEVIKTISKDYPIRWNIVGHSMAGRIITVFSYKYKNIIDSVNLISPAFFSIKPYSLFTKLPPFNLFLYLYVSSTLKKENFAKLLEKIYFRKPMDYEVENYLKPLLIPKTFEYILYMLDVNEDEEYDPPKLLDKLSFNILLIWGKKDRIVPLKGSIKLVDKIKEKNLFIIDNAGHNSMETHAEIVFEQIMKHINLSK